MATPEQFRRQVEGLQQMAQPPVRRIGDRCLAIPNFFEKRNGEPHPAEEAKARLLVGPVVLPKGSDGLDHLQKGMEQILVVDFSLEGSLLLFCFHDSALEGGAFLGVFVEIGE